MNRNGHPDLTSHLRSVPEVFRQDRLREFIGKVEKGAFDVPPGDVSEPYFAHFKRCCEDTLPQEVRGITGIAWEAYRGNLEYGQRLHDAIPKLWDWEWTVRQMPDVDLKPPRRFAHLGHAYADSMSSGYASRAWLLAALKALLAMDADQ